MGQSSKITYPNGKFTTLHNFDSTDGSYLYAGLMQATANGKFYGATYAGWVRAPHLPMMAVARSFSLSVGLGPFVETLPNSGNAGAAVRILGTDLTDAISVTFNGTTAKFTIVSSSRNQDSRTNWRDHRHP